MLNCFVAVERLVSVAGDALYFMRPNVKLSHPERATENYWWSTADRGSAQPQERSG